MKKAILVLVIGIIDFLRNLALFIKSFSFKNYGKGYGYKVSFDDNVVISMIISLLIIAVGVILYKENKKIKE